MDLTVQIEKAIKISPPHCILYLFRPCNNISSQFLHPSHIYHCFRQACALDEEWGLFVPKKAAGLVGSKIEYFSNYIMWLFLEKENQRHK
jgi:hypothetical protein